MDLRELILSRRTVHNYHPDKVPDSLVEESLRLSLWAPNHRLTFPWVYTLIGPVARERLADLAVDLKSAKEPLSDVKARAVRDTVLNPSHVVSLGFKLNGKESVEREDYATLACSVQIVSLHLWQHGIATKWSTGGFTIHPRTYEILGLDASVIRLEGALLIGRAQQVPERPERPPLEQFLRRVD